MAKTLFARGSDGKVAIFDGGASINPTWDDLKSQWYTAGGTSQTGALLNTHVFIEYGSDIQVGQPAPTDTNTAQRIHIRYYGSNNATYDRYLPLPAAASGSDAIIKALPLQPGQTFQTNPIMVSYATDYGPFYDPVDNLTDLYFHSDLGYFGNSAVLTGTATHAARARSSSTSKGLFGSSTYYNPVQGSQDYAIATHSFGTANVPFICKIGDIQAPAGTLIQTSGQSIRAVFPYITSTHVRVKEQYVTFDDSLAQHSQSYTFYLFSELNTASGSTSISVGPSSFSAGFGKLDTTYQYIKSTATNPDFYLAVGATADVSGGGLKVVAPDGTATTDGQYNGSFTGTSGRGVKI